MGVENDIFWSEVGLGFGKPAAHPHQEFPRVPLREFFTLCEPPPQKKKKKLLINLLSAPRPLVAAKASLLHCA